jgi:hypothetical protein
VDRYKFFNFRGMKRICLWSGPRNVSTALMYSFSQRKDTHVLDEPLYGPYLKESGSDHPGREHLLEVLETDLDKCISNFTTKEYDRPVLFIKNMAHHLYHVPHDFLDGLINVFLIRDPEEMLPTLINQIPEPTVLDTAYKMQYELFFELREKDGHDPLVIESRYLLEDPEKFLLKLCDALGLEFEFSMMSWPSGGSPHDGPWAPWWYHNLHRSTGFLPYKKKTEPFPNRLSPLLEKVRPLYDVLHEHALK